MQLLPNHFILPVGLSGCQPQSYPSISVDESITASERKERGSPFKCLKRCEFLFLLLFLLDALSVTAEIIRRLLNLCYSNFVGQVTSQFIDICLVTNPSALSFEHMAVSDGFPDSARESFVRSLFEGAATHR